MACITKVSNTLQEAIMTEAAPKGARVIKHNCSLIFLSVCSEEQSWHEDSSAGCLPDSPSAQRRSQGSKRKPSSCQLRSQIAPALRHLCLFPPIMTLVVFPRLTPAQCFGERRCRSYFSNAVAKHHDQGNLKWKGSLTGLTVSED